MKETIKTFVQKNLIKTSLIIVVMILLGGNFYWFQWRPSQIKKSCYNEAMEKARKYGGGTPSVYFIAEDYNNYYKWCLEKKGL